MPGRAAASDAVKIAVISSETGIAVEDSIPMVQAVKLAVDEINSHGGLLGQPVELIFLDNKSTALGSKFAAMEAVRLKATGVIGGEWSSLALAMAPVLQKAKIPTITPSSTTPRITALGNHIFRICFTDELQGKIMATFARKDLKANTAAVLQNINQQYSITLAGYFTHGFAKNGGEIVFQGNYQGKSADFKHLLTEVKKMHPDVIFIPGYSRDSALVVKQARMMGITSTFLGGDGWETKMFDYAGNNLNGTYFAANWHQDLPSPESQHLKRSFLKQFNTPVYNSVTPLTYDALGVFAHAVKKAGTLDRKKIRDVLAQTIDYPGTTGTITFDGQGDPIGKKVAILKFDDNSAKFVKLVKEETLKIAAIYALTGKAAESSRSSLDGVIHAVNEINASGGVAGKKIELIILDNQSTPIGSKVAADKAVEKGVTAIIGADWSSHSLAVAKVAQAHGIPMITNVSTNSRVTEIGNYIFRVCFTDPFQGKVMGRFAREELKAVSAVIFTNITSWYSMGLTREFKTAFELSGGRVLFTASYKHELKKLKNLILQSKKCNPDVIFLSGHDEGGFIAKEIQLAGIKATLLGGDDWNTKSFMTKGGKEIKHGYYCTHWSQESTSPVSLAFLKKYKDIKNINASFALSHDAVFLLADAVKRAGSMERKKIRDALKGTNSFQGVTGKIFFDKNRNPVKDAVINEIYNGKTKYVKTISP